MIKMRNKDTIITHDNLHIKPDTAGDIHME